MHFLAEIEHTAYKTPIEKTEAAFQKELRKSTIGYNLRKWIIIRLVIYSQCILSFVTTISIVVLSVQFLR
jgi:hypothetical protein